jgi:hypothetical protein
MGAVNVVKLKIKNGKIFSHTPTDVRIEVICLYAL